MKMRLAVVGLGYWGPNLLRNFFEQDNVKIIYACDKDKRRLLEVGKKYPGVNLTSSFGKVIADRRVDAVIIATASDSHFVLAAKALKAKKHVFVEKPMALKATDAEELVKLAKANKRIIMVGHTYEYHPAILRLKEVIEKGSLGKIFYAYSTRVNLGKIREETNALWNLAPHDFSILRFLFGQNPESVSAYGRAFLQKRQEDVVWVNLKYKNMAAQIHVSWLDPNKKRELVVVGSKKMAVFDDMGGEGKLKIYEKRFEKEPKSFVFRPNYGDVHLLSIANQEPLTNECAHFVECLEKKSRPRSDGLSGLEVVRALEAAQTSLEKGGLWTKV